jgi:hypothetical protein
MASRRCFSILALGGRLMRIFGSRSSAKSPTALANELPRVIAYGQFQLDPNSIDPAAYGLLEAELYPLATRDPDGFTRELAELVLPAGGLAIYGGTRLAGSLLGWDFQGAHYLAMLDAALQWRHETGTGAFWLAPYELARWDKVHGPGSW